VASFAVCAAFLAGCGGTTGATHGDAGVDAKAKDATSPTPDAVAPQDVASERDVEDLPCKEQGIAGFKWTYEKALQAPGSCTPEQLTEVVNNCLSGCATAAACSGVNMACYDCVFNPVPDPGAQFSLSIDSTVSLTNTGGCVQVVDPDGGLPCATAIQTFEACSAYDCRSCTVTNDPDGTKGAACAEAALTTCQTYFNRIGGACAGIFVDGGPGAPCGFSAPTAAAGTIDVGMVLCVH
jgi:hypothetical protein